MPSCRHRGAERQSISLQLEPGSAMRRHEIRSLRRSRKQKEDIIRESFDIIANIRGVRAEERKSEARDVRADALRGRRW